MQWQKENFIISDDPKLLNKKFLIDSLHTTYWAEKRPEAIIKKSIKNSIIFSLFDGKKQIGFARVISDLATYAYICDFFVSEHYRKHGLGSWLMECVLKHPATDVTLITLATRDAHNFYRKFGLEISNKFMLKRKDNGSLDTCFKYKKSSC